MPDTPPDMPRITQQPTIGLGLAALGRPGYINLGHADDLEGARTPEALEQHCHRMLDLAFDLGVRYIDAARSYGRAEAFLSSWCHAHPEKARALTIASKWGYVYTADWQVRAELHERKEHSLENLERQLAESLALLGPWLRTYQIHSATLESGVLDNAPVLDRLASLRARGIRVGLSVSGPRQAQTLEKAFAIERDGQPLFTLAQVTWNVLEQSTTPTLLRAHDSGRLIVVKEAMANGRLLQLPALVEMASRLGTTPDALALAFALAQPFCHVVLSGAAQAGHLASNLEAASLRIAPDDWRLLEQMAVEPESYWAERSRLPWN